MKRRPVLTLLASAALAACSRGGGGSPEPVYDVWLHDSHYWYDDDFWLWLDDQDDCCADPDDLSEALDEWWEGLSPAEQEEARAKADEWLEAHDLEAATPEDRRQLIEDTVQERWAALSPEERQLWLADRTARAEARRAAAMESGVGRSLDPATARARAEGWRQDMSPEHRAELARPAAMDFAGNHPRPSGFPSARGVTFRGGGGRFR